MAERRDEPGPDHAPEVEHLSIEGVVLERFPTVRYEHTDFRWSTYQEQ